MVALSAYGIEGWTIVAICVCIIFLRMVARIRTVGVRGLQPDDYLMSCIAILFPVECTMSFYTGFYGGTNNMPPEARAALSPEEVKMREKGALFFYIGWLIYPGMLWIMKFCMIFFYKRLTLGLWQQKALWHITWICGVTYIGGLITVLFSCRPIQRNWQVRPDPGILCTQGWTFYGVTGITNLCTDMMLFTIPLPLVWKAKIALRTKIGLLLMFSMGAFVMLATILRHVMIFHDVYGMDTVAMWAVRETFVACIVGNAPMIKPMFMEIAHKLGYRVGTVIMGSSGYSKSGENRSAGHGQITPAFNTPNHSAHDGRARKPNKRSKEPGIDTLLRTDAGNGSQEFIMQDLERQELPQSGIVKTTVNTITSEPFDIDKDSTETLRRDGHYSARVKPRPGY